MGTLTGDWKAAWGIVTGETFRISGLDPGRYIVDAQTQSEGDIQIVDVGANATTNVSMTSHGSGTIDGTVLDFRTKQSLPGARCQSFLSIDGQLGVTSWMLATASVSDSNGHVSLDPAPAGSLDVSCIMSSDRWSRPSAHVSLAPGAHSTVRLYSVAMATDSPGSVGLVFDGMDTSPRIAAVLPGSSAATAGFAIGDVVVAVNGASIQGLNGDGVQNLIISLPVGNNVAITIARGAAQRTLHATIQPPQ